MDTLIHLFLCILLMAMSFIIGRHWAVFSIKTDLVKHGVAIATYGEGNKRVRIVGTVEDI